MSQKTNKNNNNNSKNSINPISNMDDGATTYSGSSDSLVDSTYSTAKKQTNKKKNSTTDCK